MAVTRCGCGKFKKTTRITRKKKHALDDAKPTRGDLKVIEDHQAKQRKRRKRRTRRRT